MCQFKVFLLHLLILYPLIVLVCNPYQIPQEDLTHLLAHSDQETKLIHRMKVYFYIENANLP